MYGLVTMYVLSLGQVTTYLYGITTERPPISLLNNQFYLDVNKTKGPNFQDMTAMDPKTRILQSENEKMNYNKF